MAKIIDSIRRSLKWKLVLVTIAIVLINALTIGFFSYNKTSDTITEEVEKFSELVIKQANLNLNRYFVEYEQAFMLIGSSNELLKWLKIKPGISSELIGTFRTIEETYISSFAFQHPEVLSVTIFNVNGNEMHHTSRVGFNTSYSIESEPWFYNQQIMNQKKMVIFLNKTINYTNLGEPGIPVPILTIVKKIELGNELGYLKADISLQPALSILNEMRLGEKTIGLISDQNGQIIAHPDAGQIFSHLEQDIVKRISSNISGSFFRTSPDEMIVFETIPFTEWKTIAIVPYSDISKGINNVRNMIIFIVSVNICVSIVVVIMISSSITRRIRELRNTMSNMQLNHFEGKANISGVDEVADLGKTYNKMLEHLELSIKELTQSRLLQQEALLSALQSQINSHFVYNALESINSMASLANHTDIEETTISLSHMLRYTANYMDTTVPIIEEVKQCTDYMKIIKIRYKDDVTYEINVNDDCKNALCLKAIIQPVIENSIKHGIETTGEPIHIKVSIERWQDQYVRVVVDDNGNGFDPTHMAELQHKLNSVGIDNQHKRSARIGILNVHFRLRMYYKIEMAGMTIGNVEDGHGARVQLIFPYQIETGGDST